MTRPNKPRPKRYAVKRSAVLLSDDVVAMVDAGLEPEEIRKAVIEQLRKVEAILRRMASGEAVDPNEQKHATDRARLLLDQDVPTDPAKLAAFLATAIKSLTSMIGHLCTIDRETWFERLQSFLEP